MQTCGFYDEAGEFSYLVGLPGKSGVGGGIVAIYPMKYSVAVWSPRLNSKGNSVMGMKALELLGKHFGLFEGKESQETKEENNLLEAILQATRQEVDTLDVSELQ